MFLLRLDERDSSPLYQQIAAAIRRAIAEGELSRGERLPPARVVAEELGVNLHTVLRGFAELEAEGLLRVRRGRGVTVSGESPSSARLHQLARQLMHEARRLGVNPQEVLVTVSRPK
jgi:GntR family transcriptional regulator